MKISERKIIQIKLDFKELFFKINNKRKNKFKKQIRKKLNKTEKVKEKRNRKWKELKNK